MHLSSIRFVVNNVTRHLGIHVHYRLGLSFKNVTYNHSLRKWHTIVFHSSTPFQHSSSWHLLVLCAHNLNNGNDIILTVPLALLPLWSHTFRCECTVTCRWKLQCNVFVLPSISLFLFLFPPSIPLDLRFLLGSGFLDTGSANTNCITYSMA